MIERFRNKTEIKEEIKKFRQDPILAVGIYRLFTYIPFKDIPKDYQAHYKEEAKEMWDKDLKEDLSFDKKQVLADVDIFYTTIITMLSKGQITTALGTVSMILADLFMVGFNINKCIEKVLKVQHNLIGNLEYDRDIANLYALVEIMELLKYIKNRYKLDITLDLDFVLDDILSNYDEEGKPIDYFKQVAKYEKKLEEVKAEQERKAKDQELIEKYNLNSIDELVEEVVLE